MLPSRLTLKERNQSLHRRIRDSEPFPRIRDAEIAMAIEEDAFHKRMEKKEVKRNQKHSKPSHSPSRIIPSTKPKAEIIAKEYFSSHVLNRDPSCSKYMPFDIVHFPKLNGASAAAHAPESIDYIWMLGFQHLSTNPSHITDKVKTKKS
jgi:hypothetical protein